MKARAYAQGTQVPTDRTRSEIERLVERFGASGFVVGTSKTDVGSTAMVVFEMKARRLRFLVPMPIESRKVSEAQAKAETRRRWRALLLVLKAKLEAVASGIVEFDVEFLGHIMTTGGATVGDQVVPGLGELLAGGSLPRLLGPGAG